MARTKQTSGRIVPPLPKRAPPPRLAPAPIMQRQGYVCSCKNDSGCYIRRCTEPLAWNIKPDDVASQTDCPLFALIPKEIRDHIYEYVLTDEINNGHRRTTAISRPDRAENLLLTCKAVYLETYLLPIHLNPIRVPYFSGMSTRPAPNIRLPWHFAHIEALDITVQQVALEGNSLYDYLFGTLGWQPEARHKGVYIAPYVGLRNDEAGTCRSSDFTLLPASHDSGILSLSEVLGTLDLPSGYQVPPSKMRLQRARPLTQLTLRIHRTGWWTWTDHPTSTNAQHYHLGLDPAIGNGEADLAQRPTSTRMQELAQQRRDGNDVFPVSSSQFPKHIPGWAHIIAQMPDLKTLDLVLETFVEKKAQLENVVECAKTWHFPLTDQGFELRWDGKVEATRCSKEAIEAWGAEGEWYEQSTECEVRSVRFTRRRQRVTGEASAVSIGSLLGGILSGKRE